MGLRAQLLAEQNTARRAMRQEARRARAERNRPKDQGALFYLAGGRRRRRGGTRSAFRPLIYLKTTRRQHCAVPKRSCMMESDKGAYGSR